MASLDIELVPLLKDNYAYLLHVPAKRFGLATAWIYRRAAKGNFGATRAPEAPVKPDWQVTTLAELADLHRKEQENR